MKRVRIKIAVSVCVALVAFGLIAVSILKKNAEVNVANRESGISESSVSPVPAAATVTPIITPEIVPEADEGTPVSTETPALVISNYSVLRPNDDYPAVRNLQLRLMELGYLEADEPGSVYNSAVETAVETFQRALGIDPTGIADSHTQEQLFDNAALHYEVKNGASGSDIRSMQKMLNSLGYFNGKITGYFGATTENALLLFQSKNGLETDGKYNNEDRELLYSDNAVPLVNLTPTPKPTDVPKTDNDSKPEKTKKPTATNKNKTTPTPKPNSSGSSESDKKYPTGGSFHASGNVSGVISVAEAQVGKRYVLGDEGPDTFDCSGLVYYCLKMNGVGVGRRSASSYANNESWKLISSMNDVQKGDLLFFTDPKHIGKVTHVGIYIGGGKMIDASSSRGEVVRRSANSEYWTTNFVCARRVF